MAIGSGRRIDVDQPFHAAEERLIRHGGHRHALARRAACAPDALLDCSASINPCGPPLWLRHVIARHLDAVGDYPDPEATALRQAVAERHDCRPEEVLVAPGTESVIQALARIDLARRFVLPTPCYRSYHEAAAASGLPCVTLPATADQRFAVDHDALAPLLQDGDLVIVGHPGNPSGQLLDLPSWRRLMAAHPQVCFVIDEAFLPLCDSDDSFLNQRPANALILRSLTKAFAIPGIRIGLSIGPAAIVERLQQALPCWSVGCLEQAVGLACINDRDHLADSRQALAPLRQQLAETLDELPGCRCLAGAANYHLLGLPPSQSAAAIVDACLAQRVALRDGTTIEDLGPGWLRIAVRGAADNQRLLAVLRSVLAPTTDEPPVSRRRPALMIQGCSSDAGKSLIAAAFCRILVQDGFDVAPFKAQNMANNAGVTRDGLEIGRAQMLQAQAARLDPDVRMNPVLLKPTSLRGCQVVLMGEPVETMDVAGYHAYTATASAVARQAYDSLAAEHEVLVIEGAGSPGEVNLRGKDFVNMPMAAHAQAAVILVGDIDRGGVYASLAGHVETFTADERRLLAGFLVNKFRGDASLLADAHAWLEARTGIPVLGCVHHLGAHGLPDEDSLGLASGWPRRDEAPLRIAVVALPHLANASDLDPLAIEPDVHLVLARQPADLVGATVIILPGSKASLLDADWLQASGMASAIHQAAADGCRIIGICGGMQLLGQTIADPGGIESDGQTRRGLGLQPWQTVLADGKQRQQQTAVHLPSSQRLSGYEIHHGRTDWGSSPALLVADDGSVLGAGDSRCWGTYLHGCFDSDGFRHHLLDSLRHDCGLAPVEARPAYDLEPAIDRLAAAVRQQVDLPAIYERLGLKAQHRG